MIQTGLAKGKKLASDTLSLPYLRVANVQDGFLDLSEIKYIDVEPRSVQRYLLCEGDVLLTEGGDFDKLGRGHIWRSEIATCLHQNHIFVVRPDRSRLTAPFFAALAASPYGKRYFLSCAKQTTNLASINSTQLKAFPVLLPPLPEQRRIAEILGTWDEAIALTERRIAAARQRKQGLMQRLLTGRVRFPEFAGQPWRTTRLRSLVDIRYGKSPNGIRANNGRHPIFGTGGVVGQTDNALCEEPAVIIGRKGSIDRVQLAQEPFWAIDTTFYATPMPRIEARWVYYFLSQIDLRRYNEASGVPSLSRGTLNSIRAEVPSLPEQRRIAGVLVTCDEEIDLLNRKLAALQEQKQGLMQRLLPGRVRVRCEAAGPGVKLP